MILQNIVLDTRSMPRYGSLIRNLVGRDLKIKYRDSVMGYLWSLMNPVMMIITYIIAFKYIMGIREVQTPNIIVGITVWTFCSITVTTSANSLLRSSNLLQKVAFPRVVPVISNQLFCLIQHVVAYPFLVGALLFLKCPVSFRWLYVIAILALLNVMLFGLGLLLSMMSVFYRDVQHFLTIAVRILFWFTPIIYPYSFLEGRLNAIRHVVTYSPFTPFIRSLTGVFCQGSGITGELAIQMCSFSAAALIIGLVYFYAYQHRIMEEI